MAPRTAVVAAGEINRRTQSGAIDRCPRNNVYYSHFVEIIRLVMNHAIVKLGEFRLVPAVGCADQIAGYALQAVYVVAVA